MTTETPAAAAAKARERADWAIAVAGPGDDADHPRAQAALQQQAQFWTDMGVLYSVMGAGAGARKVCDDIASECSDAVDVCEEGMHEPHD